MNEKYYRAIDSLVPREDSVEKTIETVTQAAQSGKVIKMKTRKINKKFAAISAVAASLALIITCGAFFAPGGIDTSKASLSASTSSTKQNGFFMTAYAAEATGNEAKAIKITSDDFVKIGKFVPTVGFIAYSASDDTEDTEYKTYNGAYMGGFYNFDIRCQGENIEKVTYKIDNATFFVKNGYKPVVSRHDKSSLDKSFISKADETTRDADVALSIGENGEYECYNSYTVNYDNQPNLSKYANDISSPIQIFGAVNYAGEKREARSKSDWEHYLYSSIFKDTVITVTATFNDGSTESQKLQLNCNYNSEDDITVEAKVIN